MTSLLRHLSFFCLLIGVLPLIGWAAQFDVTRTDDPVPDDCAPADCSLREAVITANRTGGADQINVPVGAYILTIPGADEFFSETGDLNITEDLEIVGAGSSFSSVDGGDLDRVFAISEGITVGIHGLTLQNGDASSGGCILGSGTLNLGDVVITSCNAFNSGGGIFNSSTGILTMNHCEISGNSVANGMGGGSGGGLFNNGSASLRLCTVEGNTAEFSGGGVTNNLFTSEMTLESTRISGNFANTTNLFFGGGGISNGGMLTVRASTISGNDATGSDGGGLNNLGGNVTLINVTLSGNNAASEGGGIWTANGSVDMANCTIADNAAATAGGIFDSSAGSIAQAIIVSGNTGGNCNAPLSDVNCGEFPSLDSENSCGLCQVDTDPLLDVLADNGGPTFTHALLAGSPAVDGSNPSATGAGCLDTLAGIGLSTDQRGVSRPVDGDGNSQVVCDLGAYEYCPGLGPECFAIFSDGFESGDTSAWSDTL